MTRHNIPLGRILGIPIGLDYSWFVIFALLTWMLADSYFPAEFKNWPSLLYWFTGAVTAVMLFVSVLLHDLEEYFYDQLKRVDSYRWDALIATGLKDWV